jgi:hypothetical protein
LLARLPRLHIGVGVACFPVSPGDDVEGLVERSADAVEAIVGEG